MKEIIVKSDGSNVFSLEILEDNLRIYIGDNEMGTSEDFSLEEIDDLQEAISIMKDKLQRNLSNKKDIVTHIEQKDANIVSNNEQKVEEKSTYGGEISDFPIEIVEKMLENQVLQGSSRDVSVFEKCKSSGWLNSGFTWWETNDGKNFWNEVIMSKNFALFFERYPIKMTAKYTQQEHLERLMNFKIPFVRFSDKKICTITEIDNLKSYPIKVSSGEQYSYNGFFENFGNFDGSEFYID